MHCQRKIYNLIYDVTDVSNPDNLTGSGVLMSDFFPLTAEETTISIEELDDATIVGLWREGEPFQETQDDPPGNKEYLRTDDTEFEFPTEFNPNEKLFIMWYTGSAPITFDEPVTLQELKDYLRLEGFVDADGSTSDFDTDDSLISELGITARQILEGALCISIVPKMLEATITNLAGGESIPHGPVNAISTFKDSDGNDLTYVLRGNRFPEIKSPCHSDMVIQYAAGYTNCPPALKTAIKQQVAWMYVHRGDESGIEISRQALSTARSFNKQRILDPFPKVVAA